MSSRLVKRQLAALQQDNNFLSNLHHTAAAPKKKRLRPREKRKKAQKAQKAEEDKQGVDAIVLKNLEYFKSTSQSKATAQAAAVMAEVRLKTGRLLPEQRRPFLSAHQSRCCRSWESEWCVTLSLTSHADTVISRS